MPVLKARWLVRAEKDQAVGDVLQQKLFFSSEGVEMEMNVRF